MSRRTLGYIENEWTCPNCNTRNKGSSKTCENCGAPQPENVHFELGSDRKYVTDQEKIKAAQAGADIHCGYCGARNPATAENCSQCGADLKEGQARQAGRIMQTPPAPPKSIKCVNCGTENPGHNSVCSNCGAALPRVVQAQAAAMPAVGNSGVKPAAPKKKKINWLVLGGIMACLTVVCVAAIAVFAIPASSLQGTVTDVHWQTNVPVEALRAVQHSNEKGSPPSDAYDVSCHTEQSCQQKTIDKANGYSEVVEDCTDVKYCSYTTDEWRTIRTYSLDGNDLRPIYDDPSLASNQRLGDKSADLTVTFSTEKGTKTYTPDSISEFQQYEVGSTWTLDLNVVGGVVNVK